MEPPGAGVPRRRVEPLTAAAPARAWTAGIDVRAVGRLAAATGAATVAVTSGGDGFVVAALLGLAAGPVAGVTATLAVLAAVARWGTADLGAVAGDQDVLGAAVAVGPALAAASSALAALALVLLPATTSTATTGSGGSTGSPGGGKALAGLPVVVAAGALAAAVAAGPAPTSALDLAVRVLATAAGLALAWLASRPVARARVPAWVPPAVGAVALGCALA